MLLSKIPLGTGVIVTLLSTLLAYPALALGDRLLRQPLDGDLVSQMSSTRMIRGTIAGIDGNELTLQMSNGQTQTISLTRSEVERLNLRSGMEIVATIDNSTMLVQSVVIVQRNTIPSDASTVNLRPTIVQDRSTNEMQRFDNQVPIRALW